eukprot:256415-Hanusia_phi.AAC.1
MPIPGPGTHAGLALSPGDFGLQPASPVLSGCVFQRFFLCIRVVTSNSKRERHPQLLPQTRAALPSMGIGLDSSGSPPRCA